MRGLIARAGRTLLAGLMVAALSNPAVAQTGKAADKAPAAGATPAKANVPAAAEPTATFPVNKFVISYWKENKKHPPLTGLKSLEVSLSRTANGYAAPARGEPTVKIRLDQEFSPAAVFQASAIRRINQAIVSYFDSQGLLCVSAAPAEEDINPATLEDLRPAKKNELRLVIWTGTVTQVRTLGTGDRVAPDQRVNSPLHKRIMDGSPIHAGRGAATSRPAGAVSRPADAVDGDLVMKDKLDDYVYFLNRHPGRRVDASVSSMGTRGEVSLDYLIAESKPWVAYAQLANTGTKNTGEWRERFGFIHNQVSGNDDIFSVDYSTIGFDVTHSVALSYEAPVFNLNRLRYRIYGNWGEFTASDIGLANLQFTGEDMSLGGELIANIFQHKQLFVDLIGGFAARKVEVNNELLGTTGKETFFLPHLGVRAERTTERDSVWAQIMVESAVGDASRHQLDNLGRLNVNRHWVVMKWDTGVSMYLETLCNAGQAEEAKKAQTLAHEVVGQFRGQWAGGYRLIPQAEEIAGGLYTVRGYPESATAGDTVLIGTTEYRFHIPRALKINRDPSKTPVFGHPFRLSPQEEFGQADWDLIARTFCDIGRTVSTQAAIGETNDTLLGWGVGLELQIKRNISVRADWGMALKDVESANVDAGDNRFHLVFTFLW